MTTSPTFPLSDCEYFSFNADACRSWLKTATRGKPAASGNDDLKWLLAHCDEGVVWGYRDSDQWRLASDEFSVIPKLSEENLQQARLFGSRREVLIWRGDDGFRGRELADLPTPLDDDHPLRRHEEEYLLLGDRILEAPKRKPAEQAHFTLLGDKRGARHAVPWKLTADDFGVEPHRHWPLRLVVRHYFQCDDTGLIRVAASRLVELRSIT